MEPGYYAGFFYARDFGHDVDAEANETGHTNVPQAVYQGTTGA